MHMENMHHWSTRRSNPWCSCCESTLLMTAPLCCSGACSNKWICFHISFAFFSLIATTLFLTVPGVLHYPMLFWYWWLKMKALIRLILKNDTMRTWLCLVTISLKYSIWIGRKAVLKIVQCKPDAECHLCVSDQVKLIVQSIPTPIFLMVLISDGSKGSLWGTMPWMHAPKENFLNFKSNESYCD